MVVQFDLDERYLSEGQIAQSNSRLLTQSTNSNEQSDQNETGITPASNEQKYGLEDSDFERF